MLSFTKTTRPFIDALTGVAYKWMAPTWNGSVLHRQHCFRDKQNERTQMHRFSVAISVFCGFFLWRPVRPSMVLRWTSFAAFQWEKRSAWELATSDCPRIRQRSIFWQHAAHHSRSIQLERDGCKKKLISFPLELEYRSYKVPIRKRHLGYV